MFFFKTVIFYRNFLANLPSLALAKDKFILIITDMKAATSPSVAQCESLGKSPALSPLDVRLQNLLRVNIFERPIRVQIHTSLCRRAPYIFSLEVDLNKSVTN